MKKLLLLLSLCALLLGACGPFNFNEQKVYCKYDANSDTLTVKLVYNEVHHVDESSSWSNSSSKKPKPDLERGWKAIGRMLNGERVYMISDNAMNYDLEGDGSEDLPAFHKAIRVDAVVVDLDENERLRIIQVLKFPYLQAAMDHASYEWRKDMADEIADQEAKLNGTDPNNDVEPFLDRKTIDLFKADIANQHDWLAWNADGLQINFPASPELIARVLRDGLKHFGEVPEEEWKNLPTGFAAMSKILTSLGELTIQDNRVYVTFKPNEAGWVEFVFPQNWEHQTEEEAKYKTELRDYIQEQGLKLPARFPVVSQG